MGTHSRTLVFTYKEKGPYFYEPLSENNYIMTKNYESFPRIFLSESALISAAVMIA